MANYLPKKTLVGWETVFGETPAAPTPYQLCVKEVGLTSATETEVIKCIGGDIDSGGEETEIGTTVQGNIMTTSYWEQFGIYLKATLGNPVTVDNGDGTFTHTFNTTQDTIPSMFVENTIVGDTTFVEVFNGVMANTLDVSFKGKGIPDITMDTLGSNSKDTLKDGYTAIAVAATILNSTPMNNQFTYVKVDGADYCRVSEFGIKIDRGATSEDLLCDKKDVGISKAEVSGTLKSIFETGLYTKIAKGQKVSVEIGYAQTIATLSHKLAFTMGEVKFKFSTPPVKAGEKISIDTTWSAARTGASTEKLKVELTNTIATY